MTKQTGLVVLVVGLVLQGCSTPGLHLSDSRNLPPPNKMPTVEKLVDHLRCELWNDYTRIEYQPTLPDFNASQPPTPNYAAIASGGNAAVQAYDIYKREQLKYLWRRLYENHFQISVDFQIMITHQKAVNPMLTGVRPSDFRGGFLKPTPPANVDYASMQPSASYSQSLAISGQASRTEDRNFDLQYAIDFHDMIDALGWARFINPTGFAEFCNLDRPNGLKGVANDRGVGLEGNLGLDETITSGIVGLNDALWAPPQFVLREASNQRATMPTSNQSASGNAALAANLNGGQGIVGSVTGGHVQFSSKIDFTLVLSGGVNPSVSTIWFKLGSGSGGSGGSGSGGGAGGSGGAGGGGGGGGQLFSGSRTKLDTLTMTFLPDCQDYSAPGGFSFVGFDDDGTKFSGAILTPDSPNPNPQVGKLIDLGKQQELHMPHVIAHTPNRGIGARDRDNKVEFYFQPVVLQPGVVKLAGIAVHGNQYIELSGETFYNKGDADIPFRGTAKSPVSTDTADFNITLQVDDKGAVYFDIKKSHLSTSIVPLLGFVIPTRTYWDTLPYCADSLITAGGAFETSPVVQAARARTEELRDEGAANNQTQKLAELLALVR